MILIILKLTAVLSGGALLGAILGRQIKKRFPQPPHPPTQLQLSLAEIKAKANTGLWALAKEYSIPIFIKDDWDMFDYKSKSVCRGMFQYRGLRHISLHTKNRDDPYVLSHELGHFFAYTEVGKDHTEGDATDIGWRLLQKILTPTETLVLITYYISKIPKTSNPTS